MSRFLRIQIYNEQGTEIEYDNYVDDFWGIQTGSAKLDTRIMENELKFGDAFASMFQVQVFGIDDDLSNRLIQVSIVADDETNYILSHDNKKLITHDGSHIVHSTSGSSGALFYGTIDSTKKDRMGTYRNIIAYDAFYSLREFNCIDFWNEFWEDHEETTLLAFKQALFTYLGLVYVGSSLINDSLVVHNPVEGQYATVLKFGDLIKCIYQLQNACPHINGLGVVIDITLEGHSSHENIRDVRGDVEGENSSWEDFVTEEITGIGVYSTGQDLAQIVGEDGNTYNIVGNFFLLDMSAQEINDVCEPLLEQLSDIQFIPCVLKMKLPRQRLKLGDILYTDYGLSYAFAISYANSVLIDETVSCNVKSATLNKDLGSIDDIQFVGTKYAILSKDIDGLHTEFGELTDEFSDFSEDVNDELVLVHSEIDQTARQIVLKVAAGNKIVQVELGVDPSTGTEFKVGANNINLTATDVINILAGGTLNLTGKNITITSTNFSVTSAGAITAKSGTIGGFDIGTNNIHNGMTSYNDTSNNGVYIGTNGIALGKGNIKLSTTGALIATGGMRGQYIYLGPSINNTYVYLDYNASDGGSLSLRDSSSAVLFMVSEYIGFALYASTFYAPQSTATFGALVVKGAKARLANTDDYGKKLLYCYETPTPMFGDLGEGKIADDGKCYVWLDPVFTETVDSAHYQVFLQKYGSGDCWVSERTPNYFVVEGTIGLQFGWEIKARQYDLSQRRLDDLDLRKDIEEKNYGAQGITHIQEIQNEREVIQND